MEIKLTVDSEQLTVNSGQKKNKNSPLNTGFSFMELMVVVAILSILVIATLPALRNYTRGKNLKEGTNMIVSALRKTRDAAITYRKNYRVVLDTLKHAVAIYTIDDDINPVENWRGLPEFVEFDKNNFTAIANLPLLPVDPNLYYVEFKTTGGLNNFTAQTIALVEKTDNGGTKLIRVYALTGKITVLE